MGTNDSNAVSDTPGRRHSAAGIALDRMKTGAVRGFLEAARSFFLPVRLGWRLSLLLVRRLRPITEPILAAALMFTALLLLGMVAQALLSPFGL